MIKAHWKRIAGLHRQESGDVAAIWMARDPDSDTVHVYECALYRGEDKNPIIVAEGLNARGRFIPIAHNSKELAEKLIQRGCNMIPDACKDKTAEAEVISSEIAARMKSGRFRVERRLAEWLDEYKSFYRSDAKVPVASHPLMSATRHAIEMIDWSRAQSSIRKSKQNYAKVAMI
jgi:hypothetical protein